MKKIEIVKNIATIVIGAIMIVCGVSLIVNTLGTAKDLKIATQENTILMEELSRIEYEVECLREASTVKEVGVFRVTYYCNDCDECGTNNVTSDGTILTPTMQSVAVDTSIIPAGSILVMDGKLYIANDVGGAIKGREIDVMVYGKTHEEVYAMGVDYFRVWVVN